jgi:hypothetical protein
MNPCFRSGACMHISAGSRAKEFLHPENTPAIILCSKADGARVL